MVTFDEETDVIYDVTSETTALSHDIRNAVVAGRTSSFAHLPILDVPPGTRVRIIVERLPECD